MLKSFLLKSLLLNAIFGSYGISPTVAPSTNHIDECLTNTFYCRVSRALRNVIHNLNKVEKPIEIVRGLEIVRSQNATDDFQAQAENSNDIDTSFFARFSEFLRTHELNIKFSDLLAEESERFLARDMLWNGVKSNTEENRTNIGDNIEEARKKDKGQGIIMAMALMFGKMLAVLGLGGIGALALKALGIATAALMMAGLLGLKSLSEKGHGHESSHSVQYLTPDVHQHIRRRRSSLSQKNKQHVNKAEMAYQGWNMGEISEAGEIKP